jgi:hypothetical protein
MRALEHFYRMTARVAYQLDAEGDDEAAELAREVLDQLWRKLTPEERASLNEFDTLADVARSPQANGHRGGTLVAARADRAPNLPGTGAKAATRSKHGRRTGASTSHGKR